MLRVLQGVTDAFVCPGWAGQCMALGRENLAGAAQVLEIMQ